MRKPTKRRRSCVLTLKYTFICVYCWTRQRIHNTLIVVDRYLRLMGDKTIPDSAEPRLESFYPPFVAGIDLPHQGVVDSYSPWFPWGRISVPTQHWKMIEISIYLHVFSEKNQHAYLMSQFDIKMPAAFNVFLHDATGNVSSDFRIICCTIPPKLSVPGTI